MTVRVVNTASGAVAHVDDVTAALLGSQWQVEAAAAAEPAPAPAAPVVEVSGAPKGSASRRVWAEYAESLGIDPGGLTRAQLQEAATNK